MLNKLKTRLIVFYYEYLLNAFIMNIPSFVVRHYFTAMCVGYLDPTSSILRGVELRVPKNIFIAANSIVNQKVLIDGRGGNVKIGKNVDIAQETNIWTLQHDVHSDTHNSVGGPVIIEDYAWIASRVTILPGITIGRGAVVATGSVVTKDVAPMDIVAGVPARKIGKRNSKLLYTLNYRPKFR
jgi:acetyltransferase-like isoleucine patch superfamily enzyme